MKPIIQRRRSTPSAITKALSKSKHHSRETTLSSSHSDNGLPSGIFSNPDSTFILDERVQLTVGLQTQERHLILFSDMLIIAKSKSSSSLKFKKQVHLSEVWTGTCLSEVTEKKMSPEKSFVIGWPTINYVVTFSSADMKKQWLSALLWHISEMKQKEYPKNLTLQIFVLDAENCSCATTVNVSNVETAESVMKKTLVQIGLPFAERVIPVHRTRMAVLWHATEREIEDSWYHTPKSIGLLRLKVVPHSVHSMYSEGHQCTNANEKGRTSDHHLWVISGKDDPAYPLIGHEHPFSIALNCLRDSADQQQGTLNHTLLLDGTEASFLEQLPKEKQCQFVLKPRLQAPVQLRRESLQKHTKRKKSLIDWALRRSTSAPTDSPPSQSPTTPQKLFGMSLSSVCPDGILPKPIMDMLFLLYHEGPSTRGIFRRSANAKTCKELKEKLNSGDDVQVDGESVFVAAAVITDFLRNIPDSVLSSDMHGLWMEAVDTENQAHKIETIKSLVNQLPDANLILLRHLFGVLHHIEQNSVVNQMNAFNLALCIAPNMLWLPSPTGPEEESRSTKKVAMLVQFLIENSAEIFGGDIASLFQRQDKNSANSKRSLGMAQNDDSSDELEFSAYDLERPNHRLIPKTDDVFDPPSGLLLDGEQEDWDLFSEITACYQNKTQKNARADSYELLEEEGSFCSVGSIRSLSPARDRCSSEPSVCLSSQLPTQSHEPVARQSSCDATIMHNHTGYIHRLQQLQVESQKLIDEGLSTGASKARQNLWQSPQTSSKVKKLSFQKSNLSNRSSFSSLSSTTTSPSASSLSSLDSAFSYCSESSAISPTDVSSLSFMFGTSARLHAVSPKVARKSPKEWHKSFTSLVPLQPCDLDSFCDYEPKAVESRCFSGERKSFPSGSRTAAGSLLTDTDWEKEGRELGFVGMPDLKLQTLDYPNELEQNSEPSPDGPASKKFLQINQQQHREKVVKHIEIRSVDACSPSQEGLKRTKITFYMAPNKEYYWGVPVEEERFLADTSSNDTPSSPNEQSTAKGLQTVRVHIPQTVFYGQNTPLVLQSASRQCESTILSSQTRHKENLQSASAPKEMKSKPVAEVQMPTPSKGFNAFSHTIRIILPASIQSTVREYFKHNETKTCPMAEAEAVENELQSRMEWLRSQPLSEMAAEECDAVVFAEETFV